jgi:hypothetical protein
MPISGQAAAYAVIARLEKERRVRRFMDAETSSG